MRKALIAAGVAAASLAAALAAGAATNATTKLEANLRGAAEGAPASNRGRAEIRLTPSTGRVCWELRITKIDGKPNASHIHKGRRGISGNVVVPLGAGYKRQGCTTASKALVRAIVRTPGAYYVNVHNAKHPAGAMRGQLIRGT
ncbi:MAG TPA: CHRD domain-containing protein [Gaiellaceae bacterium]|nr:CHRD domain-containing protein [Gaiellaceae bacterium]